jgi:hypothetical protein
VLDDFRHRSAAPRDHRGASHRFDQHQAERLWPVDREQHGLGLPQERRLVTLADLTHEFHQRIVKQGLDYRLKILLVDAIDLGRDLERYTRSPGDLDSSIGPLLGTDASEESEIVTARMRPERI